MQRLIAMGKCIFANKRHKKACASLTLDGMVSVIEAAKPVPYHATFEDAEREAIRELEGSFALTMRGLDIKI